MKVADALDELGVADESSDYDELVFGSRAFEDWVVELVLNEDPLAPQAQAMLWTMRAQSADWSHQHDVDTRYRAMKVEQEAKRRLASENYSGGRELSWDELADAKLSWLVGDCIARGTTNFLVAKSNTGKTFAYVDMILAMATARSFLGKRTEQAKVLVVLGEGKFGFHERILGWLKRHDIDPAEVRPYLSFYEGGNLNNGASLDDMKRVIQKHNPELVILDTWAATSGISDENDAALASATLNAAREAAPDAALLFTTHPTKSSEDGEHPILRGSGALAGAADCIMTMYADPKYKSASGKDRDYLAFSTEREHGGKNRNARRQTIRGLYLEAIEVAGDTAVLMHDTSGSLSTADVWVMENLTVGEEVTSTDLTNSDMNLNADGSKQHSKSTIERYLKDSALVTLTAEGKGNKPNVYTRTH